MRRRKEWKFEVRAVPPNCDPDLEFNPTNIYAQMSEEERVDACLEGLAELLAEAWRKYPNGFKSNDASQKNEENFCKVSL